MTKFDKNEEKNLKQKLLRIRYCSRRKEGCEGRLATYQIYCHDGGNVHTHIQDLAINVL